MSLDCDILLSLSSDTESDSTLMAIGASASTASARRAASHHVLTCFVACAINFEQWVAVPHFVNESFNCCVSAEDPRSCNSFRPKS